MTFSFSVSLWDTGTTDLTPETIFLCLWLGAGEKHYIWRIRAVHMGNSAATSCLDEDGHFFIFLLHTSPILVCMTEIWRVTVGHWRHGPLNTNRHTPRKQQIYLGPNYFHQFKQFCYRLMKRFRKRNIHIPNFSLQLYIFLIDHSRKEKPHFYRRMNMVSAVVPEQHISGNIEAIISFACFFLILCKKPLAFGRETTRHFFFLFYNDHKHYTITWFKT